MKRYRIARAALRDLETIGAYTSEKRGEAQARRYTGDLLKRFQWLAEHPTAGRPRDEIARGYRSFPQGTHLIFYKLDTDDVHIIGVPHMSMDLGSYFDEES